MVTFLKKRKWIILFCFFVSFFCITICSKNSFLYVFNEWPDANAFFTVGKGWMNGLIPYKDLFEQKGPVLYLLYGIGYLFSHDTFFGIYLLEILSYTVFLYYCYKIARLFLEEKFAYALVLFMGTILVSSIPFVQGGSAEEFCLPLLAISVFSFLNYDALEKKNRVLFFNGFIAGIVALIKFNLLGFWFAWMAGIFFKTLFSKQYKQAFLDCFYFLAGMLLPILISILYFFFVGGLQDYIEAYITFNVSSYTVRASLLSRVYHFIQIVWQHIHFSDVIFALTIVGGVAVLFSRTKDIWAKLFLFSSFLFLLLGIYFGGNAYNYYYLLNEFYIVFGLMFLLSLIQKILKTQNKVVFFFLFLLFLVGGAFFLSSSPNIPDMRLTKEDFAQYRFAQIIHEKENATLLNYDFLDGGFYTVADIIPSTKYFMRQNVSYESYPKIFDSQNEIIQNKRVDFVVTRSYPGYSTSWALLERNYELVLDQEQIIEGGLYHYYLYEKKD